MKETWTTRDFRLQSGVVLPELTLAYERYGQLAPGGGNAPRPPRAAQSVPAEP